jgi:16S rRNA processing protein RimM
VRVVVGRIGRAHGIRGSVSVDVRTDDPDLRFAVGARLHTVPEAVGPLEIEGVRWHSGRLLVDFAGFTDRTAAETLRGVVLEVDVDPDERTSDPEEFFDHQLVGLPVRLPDGTAVGTVREVVHLPGQELLAITRAGGSSEAPQAPGAGEVLVPFVVEMVPEIDVASGIVIDPPPGLLDPDQAV